MVSLIAAGEGRCLAEISIDDDNDGDIVDKFREI